MRRSSYRFAVLFAIILLATASFALPPIQEPDPVPPPGGGSGACAYWNCRLADNGSASCWEALWNTGQYAKRCVVTCDGPGCWCEYRETCYLI